MLDFRTRGERAFGPVLVRVFLVLLACIFATVSAHAQKVTMESDRSADFSRYKTFAIRAGELNSKNAALNSELVRKQINDDIARGLTAKGLSEVTSGPSDLNIRYTLGSARRTQVEAYRPAGTAGGHATCASLTPKALWSSTSAIPPLARSSGAVLPVRTKAIPSSSRASSTTW